MTLFGFGRHAAGSPTESDDAVKAETPSLSKRDYEHTTADSADSTALIPAVKDEAPPAPPVVEAPPAPPVVEAPRSGLETTRRGPRRSRLTHIEPYSVTRLAFVVSVAMMIVTTVAAAIFWLVLAVTGVWGEINESVAALLSDDTASFDIKDYLGFTRMVGGTLVVSGINVILMTALATVGAHLFNLAAALLGGVETTFTDD